MQSTSTGIERQPARARPPAESSSPRRGRIAIISGVLSSGTNIPLVPLVPLLAFACGGVGAMGQSRLKDPGRASDIGLQAPIAVGARIAPEIDLAVTGSGAPSLQLTSARPEVLDTDGHHLIARSPGVAAVLIRMNNGTVLDFIHLWTVAPTRVALHALDEDRKRRGEIDDVVQLLIGESLHVTPVIYANNQELSGIADTSWHIDSPVARVLHDGARQRRRVVATAPGRATVQVELLGLKTSFDIEVMSR